MTYGQKYISELGVSGAKERINHLRKRIQENIDKGLGFENLAAESDNLGRAILEIDPNYDWVTNA